MSCGSGEESKKARDEQGRPDGRYGRDWSSDTRAYQEAMVRSIPDQNDKGQGLFSRSDYGQPWDYSWQDRALTSLGNLLAGKTIPGSALINAGLKIAGKPTVGSYFSDAILGNYYGYKNTGSVQGIGIFAESTGGGVPSGTLSDENLGNQSILEKLAGGASGEGQGKTVNTPDGIFAHGPITADQLPAGFGTPSGTSPGFTQADWENYYDSLAQPVGYFKLGGQVVPWVTATGGLK